VGFFSCFVLVVDFFEFQRRCSLADLLSFSQKMGLLFLKVPFVIEQLLPFLMFLGALSLLWRLNRGNEILILRSFGLSAWRIATPFCSAALAFGVINLTVLQPLSVSLFNAYQKRETRLLKKNTQPVVEVGSSGFWLQKKDPEHHVFYHIQNVQPSKRTLEGVSVYVFDRDYIFQTRYEALSGALLGDKLVLKDVWVLKAQASMVHEKESVLPLALTLEDLSNQTPAPQVVSFWSLAPLIRWMRQLGMSSYKYDLERQRLLAMTLWFAGLVLLAVVSGIRPQKQGGTLILLSLGLAGSLILYFIRDVTYALAGARYLPMIFATWSPCVLTFLTALTCMFFFEEGKRS
jgi:lipopolysaccharide export system permease protein